MTAWFPWPYVACDIEDQPVIGGEVLQFIPIPCDIGASSPCARSLDLFRCGSLLSCSKSSELSMPTQVKERQALCSAADGRAKQLNFALFPSSQDPRPRISTCSPTNQIIGLNTVKQAYG